MIHLAYYSTVNNFRFNRTLQCDINLRGRAGRNIIPRVTRLLVWCKNNYAHNHGRVYASRGTIDRSWYAAERHRERNYSFLSGICVIRCLMIYTTDSIRIVGWKCDGFMVLTKIVIWELKKKYSSLRNKDRYNQFCFTHVFSTRHPRLLLFMIITHECLSCDRIAV